MSHAIVPSCKCDVIQGLRHVYRAGSEYIVSAFVLLLFVVFVFGTTGERGDGLQDLGEYCILICIVFAIVL